VSLLKWYCAVKDGAGWVTRTIVSPFIRGPASLDGRLWRDLCWRQKMIEWNANDRCRKVRNSKLTTSSLTSESHLSDIQWTATDETKVRPNNR
jgi:hypothetical protein